MMAPKKLFAAALASLPLMAFGQAPAEPAKPAEPAPAAAPAPAPAAAPAPAPAPAIQIYGTLNVNAQYTSAKDATAVPAGATLNPAITPQIDVAGRTAVSTDSSNIGIRGTIDLGASGLKATYQCETAAQVDGIAGAVLCNRNSRLGLTSAYGTLFYGNWDTPLKASAYGTKAEDPFGNTDVFAFQSILGSPGFNARSGAYKTDTNGAIISFDLRAQNSIGFHSAKYMGLSAKLQYVVNEFASQNGKRNPTLGGAVVNYDNGPLSVFAAGEVHYDGYALVGINNAAVFTAPTNVFQFGATAANGPVTGTPQARTKSTDYTWRVGAGYELASSFGATTVSAAFEQMVLQQDKAPAGSIKEYKRTAWQVGLKHRMGNHELRGRYSMADDGDCKLIGGGACDTTDYGASNLALGYAYFFTKSVQGYLTYTQITNKDVGQYTFSIGGSPAVAGSTPFGADPMAVALGMRVAF